MPVHVIRSISAAALLALTAGCGGTSVTELTGPDAVRCQISFGSTAASAPASGAQFSVAVVAERDCAWSSQSQVTWIQVSPVSGQGEGALSLSIAANAVASARSGNVLVNGQPFPVTQAAAPPGVVCSYTLDPTSRSIGRNGGSRTVRVITGTPCAWSATSTVSWIHITSASTGSGSADIRYQVDRNRGSDDRVGAVVVAGRQHIVSQSD